MKNFRSYLALLGITACFLSVGVSCGKEKDSSSENASNSEQVIPSEQPSLSEQVITYSISVPSNINGGSVNVSTTSVEKGGSVTLTVSANDYYKLQSLKANGEDLIVDNEGKVTISDVSENIEIEATFVGIEVTVNFVYGDEVFTPITVTYDDVYSSLPTIENIETGYEFIGWYTQEDGEGTKVNENTIVTNHQEHTLYAKVDAKTYNLYFDESGSDSECTDKTISFNGTYGTLPTPVKDGHVFIGWTDQNNTFVNENTIHNSDNDVTLKANFVSVTTNVTDKVRLTKLPNDEKSLTVVPSVTDNGSDVSDKYNVTLSSQSNGVIIEGMNVKIAENADNVTSVVEVKVEGVVVCSFEVVTVDYVGLGYTTISTLDEFKTINGTGKYVLIDDIVINDYVATSTAISSLSADAVIDGNGHYVDGLKLHGGSKVGWIGDVNGTVRNISFINMQSADTTPYLTGLFATLKDGALLENIFVSSKVNVDGGIENVNQAGGVLVGTLEGGTIKDVILNVNVADRIPLDAYGAFAGLVNADNAKVYNSYAIVNHTRMKVFGNEVKYGLWNKAIQDDSGVYYNAVHAFLNDVDGSNFDKAFWSFSTNNIKFNDNQVLVAEAALSGRIYENFTFSTIDVDPKIEFSVYSYGELIDEYNVSYYSYDEEILTVNPDGSLNIKKDGTTTVVVTINDTYEMETTIKVKPEYYMISSVEEWKTLINQDPDWKFKLANNIDFKGEYLSYDSSHVLASTFDGVLDGQGYAIYNGKINGGWTCHSAFGTLTGTIKNIAFLNTISSSVITNNALIADNKGLVENVYVDWIVSYDNVERAGAFGGVIVGYAGIGVMQNCITNLKPSETLSSTPKNYGSIVGSGNNWHGVVQNCYSMVHDTGIADIAGTVAAEGILTRFKNQGSAQYTTYTQLLGAADLSMYDKTLWTFDADKITFGNNVVYTADEDDLYQYIYTADQFRTMISDNPAGKYRLANDIDFNGGYLSVDNSTLLASEFSGIIDGKGHIISNAVMPNGLETNNVFAKNSGTIRNIAFDKLTGPSKNEGSAIIGTNTGTISNVYVDYLINDDGGTYTSAGVIANDASTGTIENVLINLNKVSTLTTMPSYYGSIVGKVNVDSVIKNSFAIYNSLTIDNIAEVEDASGTITKILEANCGQYEKFSDIATDNKSLDTFDSNIWTFTKGSVKFGIKLILIDATVDEWTYITNATEWRTLITANPSGKFVLANDIDLAGGWVSPNGESVICSTFTGELDGQGHRVYNGWMPGGWNHNSLFPTNDGIIKNINFDRIYSGYQNTNTALVGSNHGTIENLFINWYIHSDGKHYSDSASAGVISNYTSTGTINNCIVNLNLNDLTTAPEWQGSLIGQADNWKGTLANCHAIVNGTGVNDIAAPFGTTHSGVLQQFRDQGSAQHATYADLYANANLKTFDSAIWTFTDTTISFFGKVVYTAK